MQKKSVRKLVISCCMVAAAGMFLKTEIRAEAKTARSEVMLQPVGFESVVSGEKTDAELIAEADSIEEVLAGYNNLGIANVDNNLNIRAGADENASLVGKLPRNAACEIIEQGEEWSKISSGKVDGFVKTEYLFTGSEARIKAMDLITTYAKVDTDALRVRQEPSTDAAVYTLVAQGERLEYVDTLDNGWVEVLLDDETVYVSGEYVTIEEELDTAVTMTELLYGAGVSDVRVSICEYAKQFLGNRYVYGGSSLTKGTDCSGFTMRVYEKFGISLPHSSRAQANMGRKISASEAKPGDLFFYGGRNYINHVALYIGGGQVIHASSPKTGIRINSCNYRSPVKVVRIINN